MSSSNDFLAVYNVYSSLQLFVLCSNAAACGEGNTLLLVIVAVATLIALYFHEDKHLLAAYGKSDKVTHPVAILHQMALSAPRTHFFSLFCLDMQDNCITFVLFTGTFMGV